MKNSRAVWIEQLEGEVREVLCDESSGHDFFHALRVRNLAVQLARAVGADEEVVEAAALVHDIGHANGREGHADQGAAVASTMLRRCRFPATKRRAVIECVRHHEWEPNRRDHPRAPTPEYKALADADRLDALGAIGISRAFAFGGAHGRPVWNPDEAPLGNTAYGHSSIHHFYEKLLVLPQDMYTETARRWATERVALMRSFLDRFYSEWEGVDAPEAERTGLRLSRAPESR